MNVDEAILARVTKLVEVGTQVVTTQYITREGRDGMNVELANQWATSCLNLFARVFGIDSVHYQKLNQIFGVIGSVGTVPHLP